MSKCHFYVAHALPSFWQLIDAATIYIPTSIVHLKKYLSKSLSHRGRKGKTDLKTFFNNNIRIVNREFLDL